MERTEWRRLIPWPEVTLIACGLLLIFVVTFKSSQNSCHQWKLRLREVSGAFMGAAGAEEFPKSESRDATEERANLSRAAKQVLDDRPFACL